MKCNLALCGAVLLSLASAGCGGGDIDSYCEDLALNSVSGWRKDTDTGGNPMAVYGRDVGMLIMRGNFSIERAWPAKVDGYCYADVRVKGTINGNSYDTDAYLFLMTKDEFNKIQNSR
ncbi:hypothetical protein K3217_27245 [bacterium BD-1]|nr:hypothetical protein [Ottowia caeni]